MAFTEEDLAQLGKFIESKVEAAVQVARDIQAAEKAASSVVNREAIVGRPDVPADAGPEFYIHLANGDVITSHDSASTHMDINGEQVAVIGRYQKGA